MTTAAPEPALVLLEGPVPLARSRIWALQRAWYERAGVDAWRTGTVPSFVTTNVAVARAWAKVALGFLRDWKAAGKLDPDAPVEIVELGGGPGRFAFLFLDAFLPLWRASDVADVRVRYVLTDLAEANVASWRAHPKLRPFVEAGVLDFARFDLEAPGPLALVESGETITRARNPVALVANYVFDSVPFDAFRLGGGVEALHLALHAPAGEPALDALRLRTHFAPAGDTPFDDAELDAILRDYRRTFADTVVSIPTAALRVLRHFRDVSDGRLLLLSCDKGDLAPEDLAGDPGPGFATHGSVSVRVNYDAIRRQFERAGGVLWDPGHPHTSLVAVAGLHGEGIAWRHTRAAFEDAVARFGPDDFFAMKQAMDAGAAELPLPSLLAWLRLSGPDPVVLHGLVPALLKRLDGATEAQKRELGRLVNAAWARHFPLGDARDLAFDLATLLYRMGWYRASITFYRRGAEASGPSAGAAHNVALCAFRLEDWAGAREAIAEALALDPEHAPSRSLALLVDARAHAGGEG